MKKLIAFSVFTMCFLPANAKLDVTECLINRGTVEGIELMYLHQYEKSLNKLNLKVSKPKFYVNTVDEVIVGAGNQQDVREKIIPIISTVNAQIIGCSTRTYK